MMRISVSILFSIFLTIFFATNPFAEEFENIEYQVIKRTMLNKIKCSFDIRLEKKVSKNTLEKLANYLKKKETKKYDRIFILYYLPEMTIGNGAWASSHFNPNLDVKILGISLEQEKKLKSKNISNHNIIGQWLDESPYVGSKIVLFKKNNTTIVTRTYLDGSSTKNVLRYVQKSGQYVKIGDNSFGEYFFVDQKGFLHIGDKDGIIVKLPPMK